MANDVSIKVGVETDGETADVEAVAQALESLGPAADLAEPSLAELGLAFDGLAAQAENLGTDVQAALREVAEGIRQFAGATNLDEQAAALTRIGEAWSRLGDQIPTDLEGADEAIRQVSQTVREFESEVERLGSSVEAQFEKAEQAIKEFADAAEKELPAVRREGEQARLALDRLRASAQALKSSGQGLTSGQVSALAQLETRYSGAVARTAQLGVAQQRFRADLDAASLAVGGQVRHIGSWSDLLGLVSPKLGLLAGKLAIIGVAIGLIDGLMKKLSLSLNQTAFLLGGTGREFDRFNGISAFFKAHLDDIGYTLANTDRLMDNLSGGVDKLLTSVTSLANMQKILVANGINPTNLSLEEQKAKLREIMVDYQRVGLAATALGEKIFGSAKAIDLQAQALVRLRASLPVSLALLSPSELEPLKAAVQAIIDSMFRLGQKLPPEVAKIAEELGLATTEVERRFRAWAESLDLSREALSKNANQLAEWVSRFVEANKHLSDKQLTELFGKQLQGVLDDFERLGASAPSALQRVADSLGVVSSKVEEARERSKGFLADVLGVARQSQEELLKMAEAATTALGSIGSNQLNPEQFERARAKLQELVDQFTAAGLEIPRELALIANQFHIFQQGIDLVATKTNQAALGVDLLKENTAALGDESNRAAPGVENVAAAATRLEVDAATGKVTVTNLGDEVAQLGEKSSKASIEITKGGEAVTKVGLAYEKGGESAKSAGEAVSTAADDTAKAGEALRGTAEGADKARLSLSALKDGAAGVDLSRIATDAGTAGTSLRSLADDAAAVKAALASLGTAANLGTLLTQLDQVITKAKSAKAALAEVES